MTLYELSKRPWTEAERRAWDFLMESQQVRPVDPNHEIAIELSGEIGAVSSPVDGVEWGIGPGVYQVYKVEKGDLG